MKRFLAILMLIVFVCCIVACGKQGNSKHDAMVKEAIIQLKEYWEQIYDIDGTDIIGYKSDGHFEIKNTRVVTIKDNDIEMFQDVAYIVEFVLFTDFYGNAPFFEETYGNNNVVVYKNGKMEVSNSLIRQYHTETYKFDCSDFIESVDDYNGKYNCIEKLK